MLPSWLRQLFRNKFSGHGTVAPYYNGLTVESLEDRALMNAVTWTGAAGAAAGNYTWGAAVFVNGAFYTNWANDILPQTGDDVLFPSIANGPAKPNAFYDANGVFTFPANSVIDGDYSIHDLQIAGDNYHIDAGSTPATLTVSGRVIVDIPTALGRLTGISVVGPIFTAAQPTSNLTIALDDTVSSVPGYGPANQFNNVNAGELYVTASLVNGPSAGAQGSGIIKNGTGAITFAGFNTYTGVTSVQAGTLIADSDGALGSSRTETLVSSGATLGVSGSTTGIADAVQIIGTGANGNGALRGMDDSLTRFRGFIGGGGTLVGGLALLGDATVRADSQFTDLTIDIKGISGTGNLTKTGQGDLGLFVDSSYAGNTLVTQGSVSIYTDNALSPGAAFKTAVSNGATLNVDSGLIVNETLELTGNGNSRYFDGFGRPAGALSMPVQGGSATWAGDITLDAPGALAAAAATANVTAATWAATGGGTATITTATPHGLTVGGTVTIAGISPAGFNGTFTVASVLSSTRFTYTLATNPTAYVSGGVATAPSVALASTSWAAGTPTGTATVTTSAPHGFVTGTRVTISGTNLAGYSGTFLVTVTGASSFTYALANPGSTGAGFGAAFGGTLNLSGSLKAAAAGTVLTKVDRGDVRVARSNPNYAGSTVINNGTLQVANSGALGTPTVAGAAAGANQITVNSTTGAAASVGTLQIEGPINLAQTLQLSGVGDGTSGAVHVVAPAGSGPLGSSGATISGKVVLNATTTLNVDQRSTLTVSGVISDVALSPPAELDKVGGGTLVLAANNTYTGQTVLRDGVTSITAAGGLGSIASGTAINSGAVLSLDGGAAGLTVANEALTISGSNTSATPSTFRAGVGTNNVWTGTVNFIDNNGAPINIEALSGAALTLTGRLGATAAVHKTGAGTVTIQGSQANTNSGPLYVDAGTLALGNTSGVATNGPVVVGDGFNSGTDTLLLLANNQLPDDKPVTVNSTGLFNLNGFSDTIGGTTALTIAGGAVQTGAGTLSLNGDIATLGTVGTSNVTGNVFLTATRTFLFRPAPQLTIRSSTNSSEYGEDVLFTVTGIPFTGPGGTEPAITGTITFYDGTTRIGSVQNLVAGPGGTTVATITTGTPTAAEPNKYLFTGGLHTIRAEYSGDNFYASASVVMAQQQAVRNAPAFATLRSSNLTAALLQTQSEDVTFTYHVTPIAGSALPTGTVTFFDNGTAIGTAQTLTTDGFAYVTTRFALPVTAADRTHAITATYSGDLFYTSNTVTLSAATDPNSVYTRPVSQQVGTAPLVQLVTNNDAVTGTRPITLNFTASGPNGVGTPAGTVQLFVDGGAVSSPTTLSPSGAATFTLPGSTVLTQTATIVNATWANGVVTITTATTTPATPNGAVVGALVTISGLSPSGYNGSFTITSVISPTQYTYALANDPGAFVFTGGTKTVNRAFNVASAAWAAGVTTVTTTATHNLAVGDAVTIVGVSPGTYNGTFFVTGVPNTNQFTFDRATNPNPYTGGGTGTAVQAANVVNATWAGNVATITTSAPHNVVVGDTVTISGTTATGGGYNGSFAVANVISPTQFTYALLFNPGTFTFSGGTSSIDQSAGVTGASWSGLASVSTSGAHNLRTGDLITITGVSPAGYNGTFPVTVTGTNSFTYLPDANPTAYVSGGTAAGNRAVVVTNATWAAGGAGGGTATVTTAAAHGLSVGSTVTISGITPAGYNGTVVITRVIPGAFGAASTQFTYRLAADPGAFVYRSTSSFVQNFTVASASWASNVATVVTNAPHNLAVGDTVTITGIAPNGYNGTVVVTGVPAVNRFTYALATDPGAYTSGGAGTATIVSNISNATWASAGGGTATVTTAAAHRLSVGTTVTVAGVTPAGFNGTYVVRSVVSATQFTFALVVDPTSYSGTTASFTRGFTVASASWSPTGGGTATVTTSANHNLVTGDVVTITGVTPTGYNGTYTITVTNPTTFTYALATNPSGFSGATASVNRTFTVATATWAASTATVNTIAPHNLVTGSTVTITGVTPAGYNGTYTITVTGANSFTYGLAVDPGNYTGNTTTVNRALTVTAASWSVAGGGTAAITTALAHNLVNGDTVTLAGINPAGYNGAYTVTVTGANTFTFALTTDPGAYVAGGTGGATQVATVQNATWATNVATVTTAQPHTFVTGDSVVIAGTNPSGYDGTYTITVTGANTYTYALATNPGTYVPGGTGTTTPVSNVQNATWAAGAATITTAAPHNLSTGDTVTLTGINPGGFNGTYTVTVTGATTFTYALATNPGTFTAPTESVTRSFTVAAATWTAAGTTATVTTAAPHNLLTGNTVSISGVTSTGPGSFNTASATVTVTGANTFTYTVATNPGTYTSGGTGTAIQASTVQNASWSAASGGTATITTSTAHNLTTGDVVTLTGLNPAGYNGTYTVTVLSATQFTYALASDPGAYTVTTTAVTRTSTVATASWSTVAGGTVTMTTSLPHNLLTGDTVTVSGVTSAGPGTYNGTFVITVTGGSTFTYARATNPGTYTSGGSTSATETRTVSAASWLAGTATITTSTPHNLLTNDSVTITGATPSGYNGTYTVTVTGANTFTYAKATDPGTYASAGTGSTNVRVNITGATAGAGSANITTAAAHRLLVGDVVTIAGITPNAYNGTFTVTGAPSSTTFNYVLAGNPGSYTGSIISVNQSFTITGATRIAAGPNFTVTVTTAQAHDLVVGNTVTITGAVPASYNGTYTVTGTPTPTTFTFTKTGGDPGAYTSGGAGRTTTPQTAGVTSAKWSGGSATVITGVAHNLRVGDLVTISGINPAGFNGTFTVTSVPNTTTFAYALAVDPGAFSNAALSTTVNVTGGKFGVVTVNTNVNHNLAVNDTIVISGATPAGYNGTYTVTSVPTARSFTYALNINPGTFVSGGTVGKAGFRFGEHAVTAQFLSADARFTDAQATLSVPEPGSRYTRNEEANTPVVDQLFSTNSAVRLATVPGDDPQIIDTAGYTFRVNSDDVVNYPTGGGIGDPFHPAPTGSVTFSNQSAAGLRSWTVQLGTILDINTNQTFVGTPGEATVRGISFSRTLYSAGTTTVTGAYSGDFFYGAHSRTTQQELIPVADVYRLSSDHGEALVGETVTYTMGVSSVAAGGVVTNGIGTVQFTFTNVQTGQSFTQSAGVVGGVATTTTSFTKPGTYTVKGDFFQGGGTIGNGSDTLLANQLVVAPFDAVLVSDTVPAIDGAPVVFTFRSTAATNAPIPTGTVTFYDGFNQIGAVQVLAANGTASVTVDTLPTGTRNIRAVYSGDTVYATLTQSMDEVQVIGTPPQLRIATSNSVAEFAETVTITVTASDPNGSNAPNGLPTGRVTIRDNGAVLASGVLLRNGVATVTVPASSLGTGRHVLDAQYSGSAVYAPIITTATQDLVVIDPVRLQVKSSANPNVNGTTVNYPVVQGTNVTYTAEMRTASGSNATGTVTFQVFNVDANGNTFGPAVASSGPVRVRTVVVNLDAFTSISTATATATLVAPAALGNYRVVAQYSGDSNYEPLAVNIDQPVVAAGTLPPANPGSTTAPRYVPTLNIGAISGGATTGIVSQATGNLVVNGASTYGGSTLITGASNTLILGAPNALPNGSAVTITGGTLNANGMSDTVGSLDGTGTLNLPAGSVFSTGATNAANTDFLGTITGSGTLNKVGTGAITLGATGTGYTGTTQVTAGTVFLAANYPNANASVLSGGTLGGTGQSKNVTVASGGKLSPGGTAANPTSVGILSGTGALTMTAGAQLVIDVKGTGPAGNATTGYDQFNTTGTAALGGATLAFNLVSGVVPVLGNTFTVLTASALTGKFGAVTVNGASVPLAANDTFVLNNRVYTLQYTGTSATVAVTSLASTAALTTSLSPSSPGQSVTFTVTITPTLGSDPRPLGNVQFFDNGVAFGGVQTLAGGATGAGTASVATSALTAGPHSITATYTPTGGSNYAPRTQTDLVVSQLVTVFSTTALTALQGPVVFGDGTTFQARVAQPVGLPAATGTFTFTNLTTGAVIGSVAFTGGAVNFVPTTPLPAGTNTIQVSYSGDTFYRASVSSAVTQVVDHQNFTVVGSDAGPVATVQVYDPRTGALRSEFQPFDQYTLGVKVATGDVNGDGISDVIVSAGAGAPGGHVKVYNGTDLSLMASFFSFPGFVGGVNIASGDVDGDGFADVVVGAGAGPGTNGAVKVFSGRDFSVLGSFLSFAGYQGGVTVAAGDMDGDGKAEVIVGSASSAGHVKVFKPDGSQIASYFAYGTGYLGGIFVAAGDLDGDGRAEVITGATNAPHVKALKLDGSEVASFFAYLSPDGAPAPFGVRVGAIDRNGDRLADILTGSGGSAPAVKVFSGLDPSQLIESFISNPTNQKPSTSGVFVGGNTK